jgi:hypothetical protein
METSLVEEEREGRKWRMTIAFDARKLRRNGRSR